MGGAVFPPSCLAWDQTVVEVMKKMAIFCKRSGACTTALSAPNPGVGHHRSTPPPETPGHSQASLGQSLVVSLLLSPGSWCAQCFVCALQESVSPVLYKFWGSPVGLMATSSKRAYATPRSAAPRAPAPAADHFWHIPLQETLKHSTINKRMLNPTKKDTPHPRAKEKPQQVCRRGEITLESNLILARDTQRSQTKPCVQPGDPQRLSQIYLWVLSAFEYWVTRKRYFQSN